MTQRDYRVLIGAAGWQHKQWGNEVFYPEDLPEDWYLSFYANEFPLVLLPESYWLEEAAFKALLEEINDQASPGFKCLFELDSQNLNRAASSLALFNELECEMAGLLLLVDDRQFENAERCSEIAALAKQYPLCLEVRDDTQESDISNIKAFCEEQT